MITKLLQNQLQIGLKKFCLLEEVGIKLFFFLTIYWWKYWRLINNIISYTYIKQIPGLLLFIDFEEAFDTLECMVLYRENAKLLQLWKFPFISWIKLFYTDISSSIQNNGWTSGFPIFPYFFVLCAENLGASIRQDKQIRGMNSENECKVSQHADDTTLILDGTKSSIERSFFFFC